VDIEAIRSIASGALTPVVAILALYIAYRQYRVERHKAKIELFDRRFSIYERALAYIFARTQSDEVPGDVAGEFHAAVIEARFLFGRDVCDVLEELRRRGLEIRVANSMRRERPLEEEMSYVYTMREHQQWFTRAEPLVSKAFERYLKLGWLR
jgi:hypothetical protein